MIDAPFDLPAELAILESKLEWPAPATLTAYYRQLLSHPDSCILLALEAPRGPDGPRWKIAWFSSKERNALRKAIIKVNAARARKDEPSTDKLPND